STWSTSSVWLSKTCTLFDNFLKSQSATVLSALPGVLGVKGTGALQSDALIAVVDPARFDSERFNRTVSDLGLRVWSERLAVEPGFEVR
ncbi:hypothetical protein EBZ37_03325, partial [bacterium]|nr:hypothetical protein [bacterium]